MHYLSVVFILFTVSQISTAFLLQHSNRTKRQTSRTCASDEFKCKSGECISEDLECNGSVDCSDGSDESTTCSRLHCPKFSFKCEYGACVDSNKKCNGAPDCRDGSDEKNCPNLLAVPSTAVTVNPTNKCADFQFRCANGECIDEDGKCDGTPDCSDASDESAESCSRLKCPGFTYRCAYGACVNGNSQCNGIQECYDGSDEDPKICGPRTTPTPPPLKPTIAAPGPRPDAPPGSCTLPPYPKNGKWVMVMPSSQLNPGDSAPNQAFISVNCNPRHILDGQSYVSCENGKWSSGIGNCLKVCPSIYSSARMSVTCQFKNRVVENCTNPVSGTRATFKCANFYEDLSLAKDKFRLCLDGTWDQTLPNCQPVCGIKSKVAQTLIVNGKPAKRGDYPWQVAIYLASSKELICGGSLINRRVIVTAAHCVTDIKGRLQPKENYIVAVGKYYRTFDEPKDKNWTQFSKLSLIKKADDYSGESLRYFADIAIMVTETRFVLSERVQPVCYDKNENNEIQFSSNDVIGYVTGWGHTQEAGKPSEILKELKVPYIDYDKCKADLPQDYEVFLSPDKICAGFLNQSANVCSGDSGGGLVFKNKVDGRYYLTGVVSLSPRAPTEEGGCNSQTYALYTKVSKYIQPLLYEQDRKYN